MLLRFSIVAVLLGCLIISIPFHLMAHPDTGPPDKPQPDPPTEKIFPVLEVVTGIQALEEDGKADQKSSLAPDTVGVATVASGLERSFALKNMRIEVCISKRELYVFSGREKVASYPVAVGKPEWPTRTGNWGIYEVVWNPWWHPPDEEWAWYRAIMAPGDPDNPLGKAQLIYDAPRSIHGTIEPSSIGRAASHGSIRVTNEVAMKLARHVMESAGVVYNEEWYREVQNDRSRNVRIRLSQRVPIRVYQ